MPYIPPAIPIVQGVVIPTVFVKGGVFPMGMGPHSFSVDAKPTWKQVSDFYLGETVVTVGQRNVVMNTGGDLADARPANKFSYWDAEKFVAILNAGLPAGEAPYGIPTGAEWEWAARGGAPVDVRALMERESIELTHENLIALAEDRLNGGSGHGLLESFVIGDWPETAAQAVEAGIRIHQVSDPEVEAALHAPRLSLRAMWMYPSGRAGLTGEAVWYGQSEPAPQAKWGEPTRLGHYTMAGNLLEWVADAYAADRYGQTASRDPRHEPQSKDSVRSLRGGSGWSYDPGYFRASCRNFGGHPNSGYFNFGFRVARSVAQDSPQV